MLSINKKLEQNKQLLWWSYNVEYENMKTFIAQLKLELISSLFWNHHTKNKVKIIINHYEPGTLYKIGTGSQTGWKDEPIYRTTKRNDLHCVYTIWTWPPRKFQENKSSEEFAKLICDPPKAGESFSSHSSRRVLGQNGWLCLSDVSLWTGHWV